LFASTPLSVRTFPLVASPLFGTPVPSDDKKKCSLTASERFLRVYLKVEWVPFRDSSCYKINNKKHVILYMELQTEKKSLSLSVRLQKKKKKNGKIVDSDRYNIALYYKQINDFFFRQKIIFLHAIYSLSFNRKYFVFIIFC
jgi:hypothetical protein